MNFDKKNNIYKIIMIIVVTALVTFLLSSVIFYNYYMITDGVIITGLCKYINI